MGKLGVEEANTRACLLFQVWGNRGYDGVSKLSSSCLGGSWVSLQPCRKDIAQKGGGSPVEGWQVSQREEEIWMWPWC